MNHIEEVYEKLCELPEHVLPQHLVTRQLAKKIADCKAPDTTNFHALTEYYRVAFLRIIKDHVRAHGFHGKFDEKVKEWIDE